MKNFTQKFTAIFALVFTISFTVNAQQIGDIYEGGYIFQINEDGTGLVASIEDLTEGATNPYAIGLGFNGYEWGCLYENVEGADGIFIGTGYQNTMDIVNQGCITQNGGITAVQAALDAEINDYSDWYLPSKDELNEMYNTIGNGGSQGNIGGFETSNWPWYWSSSEYNNNYAWSVNFGDGNTDYGWKNGTLSVRVIRSVTFGEEENTEDETTTLDDTADNYLDLPEGWSMFGYTCLDSVDAMVGFSSISDKIEIVKDEWGLSYLPSWDFNAMGSLQFSEGYQIKMIEEVTDFEFCESVADQLLIDLSNMQQELNDNTDYYQNQLNVQQGNYEGLLSEQMMSSDSICNINLVATDSMYGETISLLELNYLTLQESSDSLIEVFAIQVQNLEDSILEITPEDGISQADVDAAVAEVEANFAASLSVGDFYQGGIVFQINEDGTGLVSAHVDLGVVNHTFEWGCHNTSIDGADDTAIGTGYQNTSDIVDGCSETPIAASLALAKVLEGYDDWYLPSKDELVEMYNTIGNGGPEGNIGGFSNNTYWSSSEYSGSRVWIVNFTDGFIGSSNKNNTYRVRVIRAF